MGVSFADWTKDRTVPSLGTNSGAQTLAFQNWHHFKEAFPPEIVRKAIEDHGGKVTSCLDPFGGSGTTALACQFLDIESTTVEVNPFLADVIRAKLCRYDADALSRSLSSVLRNSRRRTREESVGELPQTFVEPGHKGRWIFSRDVASEIRALHKAIESLPESTERTFFRALLGGILVPISNVRVNGKGRRYRGGWRDRQVSPQEVRRTFSSQARGAIADAHRYRGRPEPPYLVIEGDARSVEIPATHDLAVFSPPYPNSFDYTDVYNVELWMLGYLGHANDNARLRGATLTSHVQIHRQFAPLPAGSTTLLATVDALHEARESLWSKWIPEMVGAYFADMVDVLGRVGSGLDPNGSCSIVVGDSRYAGVHIPTAQILADLASHAGWSVTHTEAFRSMRSSAQQGGRKQLAETLIVLRP